MWLIAFRKLVVPLIMPVCAEVLFHQLNLKVATWLLQCMVNMFDLQPPRTHPPLKKWRFRLMKM
jgi:hypothetical protein